MAERKPVTSELLDELANVVNPDWEAHQAKFQRAADRRQALSLSVDIEKGRNLTEEPQAITDRVLKRAAEFYDYLETDNG